MSACDLLHAFADGELSAEDATAFREHLATCDACAAGLADHMMLEAVQGTHAPAAKKRAVPSLADARARRLSRWWLAALVPAAAAAWALWPRPAPPVATPAPSASAPVLEVAASRSLEVRLAYAPADKHRPYDVARAGGAPAHENVPLAVLAELEARGDLHGVAAGLALAGEGDRAASFLDRAPASPDIDVDRGALLVARGRSAEALALFDGVLAKRVDHPQALFDRAVALRDLGLRLAAAESFERVAAQGEPGWAEEARLRAAALRGEEESRQASWKASTDAALAMVAGGAPIADELARAFPDRARLYLYHAVRTAPSRERALALVPLAESLDARIGGHSLADYVRRAAARDFTKRAPLAATYARLFASPRSLDEAALRDYFAALRAAGEDDMRMGALRVARRLPAELDEFERLATASGDPWPLAQAAEARERMLRERGDYARAEEVLRRAIAACEAAHIDYVRAFLEYDLATLLEGEHRSTEARALAAQGLSRARAHAGDAVPLFVFRLGAVARLMGDAPMLRAYMREAELLDPKGCETQRSAHEVLAEGYLRALDPAGAAAEIAAAPRCDQPITSLRADVLSDLARLGRRLPESDALETDIATARAKMAPGEQAYVDVVAARLRFASDPAQGEALARRALDDAAKLPASDAVARTAELYARRTLAVETARAGRAADALAYVIAGAGGDPRTSSRDCALGVALDDDRALAVTRDANGAVVADVTTLPTSAVDLDRIVPPVARARIAACASVRVYALPPLHGLARLLAPEIAWAYASGSVRTADAPAPRRLVVSDAKPPASLGLPPLRGWSTPAAPVVWLQGESATPRRLTAEIADATEIEIHAHGFVDLAQSDASMIALTPDSDGRWWLTAGDVRAQRLRGHPLVVLGACRAAHTVGYLHEAWSLPVAFVRAGARAVLASASEIPDADAATFFDAVLARVRGGAAVAIALRDERVRRLARDPASWVRDVVDFE